MCVGGFQGYTFLITLENLSISKFCFHKRYNSDHRCIYITGGLQLHRLNMLLTYLNKSEPQQNFKCKKQL